MCVAKIIVPTMEILENTDKQKENKITHNSTIKHNLYLPCYGKYFQNFLHTPIDFILKCVW